MSHYHAVVWLDHTEAHVMHFSKDEVEKFTAHSSDKHPHLHHKRGSVGSGHRAEDAQYFGEIVKMLGGAQEILVVGPGQAKLELVKYVHKHHHDLVDRVLGVESVDHPSDGQLVAYARKYFDAKDRMRDQGGHLH
ncbi:MAG: translational machinery protein [Betaproteobacteria bacterium]|nr:translational machinery protein [Betaproteobacteria bacterium]